MPPPVDSIAAQGQPQDLQFADIDYYNMANDHPPSHENRDYNINNFAGVALDVPAGHAPPAPVSTDLTFPHAHF